MPPRLLTADKVATFVSRALHGNRLTELIEPASGSSSSDIISQCHEGYCLLETWAGPRENIPRPVHTGNLVYQKAAQILLLPDLAFFRSLQLINLGASRAVIQSSPCVLNGRPAKWAFIRLAIIAASHAYGANRPRVVGIIQILSALETPGSSVTRGRMALGHERSTIE
ncbi:hypothetical protein BU15DRAFT_59129 [Melanogaster broomeanus]|nr:hypothetical protein BU15DRAFT_59129 [Melanogaster broomeanus]